MNEIIANAHKAAQNLYTASRSLALPADQHELLGTSHDLLHVFINDAAATAEKLTEAEKQIEELKQRLLQSELREMETQGGAQ